MHSEHSRPLDAFCLRRHGVEKSPETTEYVVPGWGRGGSEEWESSNR